MLKFQLFLTQASDAFALLTNGESKLRAGLIKEANEIFNEALSLFNNVYGAMHTEILRCNHNLGLIAYFVEDLAEVSHNTIINIAVNTPKGI